MSKPLILSGALNINKPPGPTSHDAVKRIRRLLKTTQPSFAKATGGARHRQAGLPTDLPTDLSSEALAKDEASAKAEARRVKVGHAGTLDPFASGVLLVLIGPATKLVEYIHLLPKTYEAQITLGATSDTDDTTGTITPVTGTKPNLPIIQTTLNSFIGTIQQIPPAHCAVKIKGKRAYILARQGSTVRPKPRPVTIHQIQVVSYQHPTLNIKIQCSSGTYIRSLARDIGHQLKTGAYVSKLRRTSIGPPIRATSPVKQICTPKFDISQAITLGSITFEEIKSRLVPTEQLVCHLPSTILPQANVAQLRKGRPTQWGTALPPNQPIAMLNKRHKLIGIGKYNLTTHLLSPTKIL